MMRIITLISIITIIIGNDVMKQSALKVII